MNSQLKDYAEFRRLREEARKLSVLREENRMNGLLPDEDLYKQIVSLRKERDQLVVKMLEEYKIRTGNDFRENPEYTARSFEKEMLEEAAKENITLEGTEEGEQFKPLLP